LELWLQGNRIGDMLRFPQELRFPTGNNQKNEPYGPETCIPMSLWETISNPNF
jgi:hypothetical protein